MSGTVKDNENSSAELVKELSAKKDASVFNEDGTVTLRNGKIAKFQEFKGRHVREAQKAADGDSSKMMFAMMAMCITIDGQPLVMEDFDNLNGGDCLKLQGAFAELNF